MTIEHVLNRVEEGLRATEDAVRGLRSHLAADLDVLRLTDDLARCHQDLARLRAHLRLPTQATTDEVIVVPDGDYDAALWDDGDFDAEGLGVPGRRAP
jgi:hypothetical protein